MEKQNLDCKDKTSQQLNKSLSSQTYCHPLYVASSGFNSHNYAKNLSIKIVLDSPRLKSSLHTCFLIELDKLVYDWKKEHLFEGFIRSLKKDKRVVHVPHVISHSRKLISSSFIITICFDIPRSVLSTKKHTSMPLISACLEVGFSSKAYGLGA